MSIGPGQVVMDPFCGTGTTLVECKKLGIETVGIEANPVTAFASSVKTDWSPAPSMLARHATAVADAAKDELRAAGLPDDLGSPLFNSPKAEAVPLLGLPAEQQRLLLRNSISPLPLHKLLLLRGLITEGLPGAFSSHERLALARTAVECSNLKFGPEVGVSTIRADAPVVDRWVGAVHSMSRDLSGLASLPGPPSHVHTADARSLKGLHDGPPIDAVFTSPPYPNEKDYTRTTRLESVILSFVGSRRDMRAVKADLLCSNTRCTYRSDNDDQYVRDVPEVQEIAARIEARRIELGKESGFERLYARVTRLYFGGMARHLAELRPLLRSGARLAYVVGDQASFLRVMIRTGRILADIAERLGYEHVRTDLFRTRLATATKEQLREEVVVLRWPGKGAK